MHPEHSSLTIVCGQSAYALSDRRTSDKAVNVQVFDKQICSLKHKRADAAACGHRLLADVDCPSWSSGCLKGSSVWGVCDGKRGYMNMCRRSRMRLGEQRTVVRGSRTEVGGT